jgi:phage/plasmid-associated DNA primase
VLGLKTTAQLADEAFKLAQGQHLVRYHNITYIPADYETLETAVPPDPDRTIWLPMGQREIREAAANQFDTLFRNPHELGSFEFMVAQNANPENGTARSVLVRTHHGLKELDENGKLITPDHTFRPNTVVPMLNEDPDDKAKALAVIVEWLDSEEDAESLLSHLATCLSPGWSVVKYLLLLGEGRNGKGVLLRMVETMLGSANVSKVSRQLMSEQSPAVLDLNGKLANIVYDGRAEYVKDSGPEKSLIAGEPVGIRKLYESNLTEAQTNALFMEGLQKEPKTSDKSMALQKRIVRFYFPNIYDLNRRFEKTMLSEQMLGAFLALLVDRYVPEDDLSERLAPTQSAVMLQLEAMHSNSMGLQYLRHLEEHDPLGAAGVVGMEMATLVAGFHSWRIQENDLTRWSEPDVQALFAPLVKSERRSKRETGRVTKVRVVTALKSEAAAFIEAMRGDENDDADVDDTVVDD